MNKEFVKFVPFGRGLPSDIGHYYTEFNKKTCEGRGFFGSPESPQYDFVDEIEYCQEWGGYVFVERTKGYGQGCIWSKPRIIEYLGETLFVEDDQELLDI